MQCQPMHIVVPLFSKFEFASSVCLVAEFEPPTEAGGGKSHEHKESNLNLKKKWQRYVSEMPIAEKRITSAAFQHPRNGIVPSASYLTQSLGITSTEMLENLQITTESSSVTLDGDYITCAAGLSATVTRHRLQLDGVDLYCRSTGIRKVPVS